MYKNDRIIIKPSSQHEHEAYTVRFEENNDGTNTYTMVLPLTAEIVETGNSVTVTL